MRLLIFSLLLLWFTDVLGQNKSQVLFSARASENYVNIPTTRVNARLPEGYRLGSSFVGIQSTNVIIEVYDLPGADLQNISRDFTNEQFTAQGFSIVRTTDTLVDNFKARINFLQKDRTEKCIALVFGDQRFSVIALATYPAERPDLERQIRDILASIQYGQGDHTSALTSAAFRLDDSKSPFRYRKYAASTYYYTPENSFPIKEKDSYVAVTQLAWDYSTSPKAIGELMVKEMSRHGLHNTVVKKQSNRNVNGYRAYESEISALKSGEPCTIYQMVVVHNDKAVVFHGIDTGTIKKAKESFKRLAHTLELK